MQLDLVDKAIVQQVNKGSEQAFAELYKAYYAYLNAVAIYYLQDKEVAQEVVDDVFLNVWEKRENLVFPIHYYLVRSVQNGCLNYIRSQRALQTALDGHRDEVLFFLEEHILSTSTPLEDVELKETEAEIRRVVDNLPVKMRAVFEAYFYDGKSAGRDCGRDELVGQYDTGTDQECVGQIETKFEAFIIYYIFSSKHTEG